MRALTDVDKETNGKTKRYYANLYAKRGAIWAFGMAAFISLPFAIASLFASVIPNDWAVIPALFLVALTVYLISLLSIVRFYQIIARQEALFGVSFDGQNAEPLFPRSLVFLAEDWLIVSGRCAFYRGFIRDGKIHIRTVKEGRSYGHYIRVHATDGKTYAFRADSSSSAKKIKAWENGRIPNDA